MPGRLYLKINFNLKHMKVKPGQLSQLGNHKHNTQNMRNRHLIPILVLVKYDPLLRVSEFCEVSKQ